MTSKDGLRAERVIKLLGLQYQGYATIGYLGHMFH